MQPHPFLAPPHLPTPPRLPPPIFPSLTCGSMSITHCGEWCITSAFSTEVLLCASGPGSEVQKGVRKGGEGLSAFPSEASETLCIGCVRMGFARLGRGSGGRGEGGRGSGGGGAQGGGGSRGGRGGQEGEGGNDPSPHLRQVCFPPGLMQCRVVPRLSCRLYRCASPPPSPEAGVHPASAPAVPGYPGCPAGCTAKRGRCHRSVPLLPQSGRGMTIMMGPR